MSPENYSYIDTKESLALMCEELSSEDVLGIDLECENNLHHYGTYISLIQISSKSKHWVVDIIALGSLGHLRKIFVDRSIQKIFHDVSFDLRILNFQFGCKPKNIYDTQIGALLVGKTEIGLGPLLMEYFEVKKQCKFQMADWTKRPLTPAMLSYAVKDTTYLIRLRDLLNDNLKELGRLTWAQEEFDLIESARYEKKPYTYKDFKGYAHLTDAQRSLLKAIFSHREQYAQEVNMPIHFVIPNKKLLELVKNPPASVSSWKTINGVHPVIKRNAITIFNSVESAKERKITIPVKEHKRYTEHQKQLLTQINSIRDDVADNLQIARHLIMNKDQMHDIIRSNTLKTLHSWQKDLLTPKLKHLI